MTLKLRRTLPRHAEALGKLNSVAVGPSFPDRYIIVAIDGPESINRQCSWASSFNDEDTHKIFQALADQTRP